MQMYIIMGAIALIVIMCLILNKVTEKTSFPTIILFLFIGIIIGNYVIPNFECTFTSGSSSKTCSIETVEESGFLGNLSNGQFLKDINNTEKNKTRFIIPWYNEVN